VANYTIRKFKADIDEWIEAAENNLFEIVEVSCEQVIRDLVMLSPVDTGRFRGNWQITFNEPALYALNEYDKQGGATINAGRRALSTYVNTRGVGITSIYFSNMLVYANALEHGYSQQAPAGVLGIVAVRLRYYFAFAVREARSK
jgi:hypothetical protein